MKIKYSSGKVPKAYKCAKCEAHGCKLYREYQSWHPVLMCAPCTSEKMKEIQRKHAGYEGDYGIETLDAVGLRDTKHGKTDQIGLYIPAVPDEEGAGFWGYTSIPQAGCDWWRNLPSLPEKS